MRIEILILKKIRRNTYFKYLQIVQCFLTNKRKEMSFPDKQQRKMCWDSRDRYWDCLDEQNVKDSSQKPKACTELRKVFENSCPAQWVTHFDRKRDFNLFKEKMQKEGFEPIKDEN